jgi:small conductance mechanosensitive channel
VRPWANNEDYGLVFSETLESCNWQFDAAIIQPYVRESTPNNLI